eukprot:SAG11_NODE_397_length_9785_cov_3.709581_4_plen_505_part_00
MSRLIIKVALLPLGSKTLFLSATSSSTAHKVSISSLKVGDDKAGFVISNSQLSVDLSAIGLLESMSEGGRDGKKIDLFQDIMAYWGNSGVDVLGDGGSESDAYVFSPQGPASSIARHTIDTGYWPGGMAGKLNQSAAAVSITGPLMEEVSACFGIASKTPVFGDPRWSGVWQATRVFKLSTAGRSPPDQLERAIETSYLVSALSNNIDIISRFSTGLSTAGILHADEAGWTDRAHPRKLDYFSMNSQIGCNYKPTSAWAAVHATTASASVAMLTDRSRGAASLQDGELEYILHRHATGGNGRGPSDGDPHAARGAVTILPSASHPGFLSALASTPQLALRRAHPVAVLTGGALTSRSEWRGAAEYSPLSRSLPEQVHLFSLGRRALQKFGGHVPDYPSSPAGQAMKQGALRLQSLEPQDAGSSNVEVDVSTLFNPVVRMDLGNNLEERTLSLSRRPDEVHRRTWHGVGMGGEMLTPPQWRGLASNSSTVSLAPSDIRSFVFPLG